MHSRLAVLANIFASVCVSASSSPSKIVLRTSEVLSQPYATLPMHNHAALQRRDVNTTVEGIQVKPDGTIDLKAWEEDVDKACREALTHVPSASNPSGNCICYNIPSLDTSTGVFAADLRLYQISEPSGDFKGISAADIKVSVAYKGASASPVSPDQFTGAGMVGNISGLARRDDAGGPKLMQLYLLVGKADQSQKLDQMTLSDWEAITLPTLTLAAKTPAGQDVNTTVSVNEASFLRGVFSQHVVRSDFAAAQANVQEQMAALANGTVAFVLPGTQLMIFPIGTIITSIWLVIGLAAYGWGTFERINYAEMYKQRTSKNKGF